MKKEFSKKLVLKKHTLASLNAEELNALNGGNMNKSNAACSENCTIPSQQTCVTQFDWGCRG